mgnify:CR=1 FL=1
MSSKTLINPPMSFSSRKKIERNVSNSRKENNNKVEAKEKNEENTGKYPDNSNLRWWSSFYFDYLKYCFNWIYIQFSSKFSNFLCCLIFYHFIVMTI